MTNETWNKYQNEYRKNHYKQVSAYLEPELVDKFKAKLRRKNTTFTDFLRKNIEEYLGKK